MYRKSLLALMILATFSVTAATDKTIIVSTFEDEDGENASACSLREAIKAATDNRSYGGCSAGQLSITDQIKLKAGTYKLKKTLVVGSNLVITGDDAANYEAEDTYTGIFPARSELKTTIEGEDGFGLFDTTAGRSGLTLNNVILSKGKNAYGGAIRAGGPVTLNRVYILNSVANASGGAIYLEGVNANLIASDVLFQGNNAPRGAVIGMSCIDNLGWTSHSIALERNSIINNGSASAKSIIEYCGTAVSTISASTVAKNISIDSTLKFTHDEANKVYVLSPNSSLVLNSNTIVENTTNSTLLYDNVGNLSLSANILAYNKGGKSCRYGVANPSVALKDLKTSTVSATLNAVKPPSLTGSQDDVCDLPGHIYAASINKFVDVSNITFSSLLNNLTPLKDGTLPFF
ncbi:MAG: CSLREA domain-containing protein [Pedobacter sp.]|nr:MAG: CSLREA domain-containing protein [Pedobacter sp.]